MVSSLFAAGIAALLPLSAQAISGSGHSTRYWDCCKPSCAWSGKASVSSPVRTCNSQNQVISDSSAKSGCESGGTAYTCPDQSPWAVNDLVSYGFAATAINGQTESNWCCACYALTFTSGKAIGKIMLVQSVNTGSDLADNQFDLQIPGGGTGIFDGCSSEFGGIAGAQYGGISNVSQCASMPSALQAGCEWRFNWFRQADNPTFTFQQIQCPAALTKITGCTRSDDSSQPVFTMPSVTTWNPPAPTGSADAYGQCDGTDWSAPKQCPSGYVCSQQTQYYWQCVQGTAPASSAAQPTAAASGASSPPPPSASSSSSTGGGGSTGNCAALYGQCGGSGWTGPTCCASGTCKANGQYYSQCT